MSGFYALITDITQHKEAEKHSLVLLREVNHRAKNILAVVQAIARQTVHSEDAEKFVARLVALGASQELLVEHDWRGIDLTRLIRSQLGHFDSLFGSRITANGEPLYLAPAAAQTLGMALHELATNWLGLQQKLRLRIPPAAHAQYLLATRPRPKSPAATYAP